MPAALARLVMAIWWLVGTVLTSVFTVGLIMIVVIAATGPHPGPPGPDPDPGTGALVGLVVACGLLGLPLLGSYSRVRRYLQRSRAAVTADHDLR
jgi:hypothetical protein